MNKPDSEPDKSMRSSKAYLRIQKVKTQQSQKLRVIKSEKIKNIAKVLQKHISKKI